MTLQSLHIALLTASASRAGGGVFEAVVRHAALIRDQGGEAHVFALHDDHAHADRARFGDTPVHHFRVRGPRQVGYAPALLPALLAAEIDLLHLHGIWMYPSRAGERWARATGKPYVVSPHGMLDPWITARGRWKKALARAAYERANWRTATAMHALTAREASEIRREADCRDTVVIPNAAPPLSRLRRRANTMLYLGRIHPKKNIVPLVAAFAAHAPADATLTIAGWGDAPDVAALRIAVAAAGPAVRFVGAVAGAEKQRLLEEARWLVLPSFGEGLPMAVLEAWAAGTPTIMTPQCNLPDGFAHEAAIRCGHGADEIGQALRQAWAEDAGAWQRRALAAQMLAAGPFSPTTVAERWAALYRKLARP